MKLNKLKKNISKSDGFTLVEMIVTVSVFSVLMTIIGAIFTQSLDLQRRAFNLQILEENSRFALEAMAREIRFSEIVDSDSACPGTSSINLKHPVNGDVQYRLEERQIIRQENGVDGVITSQDVDVTNLSFCISGTDLSDGLQPWVTVLVTLKAGIRNIQEISLQTTLSPRDLDL